jgi:hypothetical protein
MRYIAQRIRPEYGTPAPGTSNTLIREYANPTNALRYMHRHLAAPHFEPGQYEVRTFPQSDYRPNKDGTYGRLVGHLYKRV